MITLDQPGQQQRRAHHDTRVHRLVLNTSVGGASWDLSSSVNTQGDAQTERFGNKSADF